MQDDHKLNKTLMLIILFGHLMLACDAFLEHYEHLPNNNITWIPIICGTIVFFIGIIFYKNLFNKTSVTVFNILMTLSLFVGMTGLYFHNSWRMMSYFDMSKNGLDWDPTMLLGYTPAFAPAAFCGLSIMALLILNAFKSK